VSVSVRPATLADTRAMADLLNEIIARGGTTAITEPLAAQGLADWMDEQSASSAWHVAEDNDGAVRGFQWIGPHTDLPPEACDIATFVAVGRTQLGIGSRLFDATAEVARLLGYEWISAEIRADNEGGLSYYQSRGFRVRGHREGVRLGDGSVVDKVLMHFDLD
jgi:L-amino acid N-acyltransferase YncA